MEFRIADTFTDSLARLPGDAQKLVKTTAFDLQLNPASPGHQFHKLDRARDRNFWSVRVGADIRLIVHRQPGSLLLCYVDHHDRAYTWAERRTLEVHPKTGAAQFVEIRERVEHVASTGLRPAKAAASSTTKSTSSAAPALQNVSAEALLAFGVPEEWLNEVLLADEDQLLALADHLPAEAAEAVLEFATGGTPRAPATATPGIDPFAHPDAQRRFLTLSSAGELERAFAYPWDKWTVFLHPDQRALVARHFNGPARVSGAAGTGKTIVALHRAVHLARANPDSRVLLTTFSEPLANALTLRLRRLVSNEPRLAERVEVAALDAVSERLYTRHFGSARDVDAVTIERLLREALLRVPGAPFSMSFLMSEWRDIVDAWQLDVWESYRDVKRLGRKTRLPEAQRATLWSIFAEVRKRIAASGATTRAERYARVAGAIKNMRQPPFDFVVVDECQDVSVPQLRLLATLGADRANALFFAGDLGQRIFQQPFSWKSVGIDIRGRSRTLHVNYRTSHQIRRNADRLLDAETADVDGNVEVRKGTVSVFNGPEPLVRTFTSELAERDACAAWLRALEADGFAPHEIGVFVRSEAEVARAIAAIEQSRIPYRQLDEKLDAVSGYAAVCTIHLAKGLEFRAVAIIACDDEVIPSQERIESVADESDLEEVYNTERHLLYVACTRARERLLVTGLMPGSEFLGDLGVSAL